MKDSCYLIGTKKGIKSTTVYKNSPGLEPGEIRIKININIPDSIFNDPAIEGTLTLTEEQARNRKIEQLEFELKEITGRE